MLRVTNSVRLARHAGNIGLRFAYAAASHTGR
jgi:hypothetical protein